MGCVGETIREQCHDYQISDSKIVHASVDYRRNQNGTKIDEVYEQLIPAKQSSDPLCPHQSTNQSSENQQKRHEDYCNLTWRSPSSCLLRALFFSSSFFLCKTSFLSSLFPPLQATPKKKNLLTASLSITATKTLLS